MRRIADDDLRDRHGSAVIAAHHTCAPYERGYRVAACDQVCTDLAADQPGGAGDEDFQQQAAAGFCGAASDWPNGTAVPQPGNTP